MTGKNDVTILGAGSIGLSFAAVFADAGFSVTVCDPDAPRRAQAGEGLAVQRDAIALAGLRRGLPGQVTFAADGDETLPQTTLVIECGPENLSVKQAIFAGLLAQCPADAILVTASSAIPMSQILPDPQDQRRCLVAHPVNPPAVLRMIELCPAPATDASATDRAAEIFAAAGFAPVRLGHEIEGFVLNRLQGAVLREAYRLVDEGVTDVAGIEAVMRLGLGPRWALSGPFETAELNTPGGIRAHAARMGPAYGRMGAWRGETVDWHAGLIDTVEAQRRAEIAADQLPARAAWRARAVARLVAARDVLMGERP
ncbi:MAG: 3-hydroxyacyl-CoA dehydrogenase NAD-binding domain-containing protein [Pseudotabrizicola sp.]|uniref:3-hydroxyacyl-CoA dehydrogenase NAD-binding domain-containing protein n=1 Tax=Pseudotabrizicola sp. TaxID=2939647 RepID=UPI002715DCFC|nr:3-hydroxyacyl-CoA dehydrogenase NAD-binding domain-containing protein [Pseudotabrizicola sp.]MDO9636939.1 3-hydroxyacyl-CoA dehydrogenase NAD-binding domain-containing protein [Pseudotabrizicola sp.]